MTGRIAAEGPRLNAQPPIRLIYYSHTGAVSGAEVVLLGLLRNIDRERFDPVLLCPDGPLVEAAQGCGVRRVAVPELKARFTKNPIKLARYMTSLAGSILALRRAIRAEDGALVHANAVRAGLVATLATVGLRVPILWHIHDILPEHPLTSVILRIANRMPGTNLLAVSEATARGFQQGGVVQRPVEVVYNSVEIDHYRPDAEARERMRRELGLRDDQVAIGVIGQLTKRKGLIELVEAYASVCRTIPESVLVLVGAALFNDENQRYAEELRQRIADLQVGDQVWMVGAKRDIRAVMNAVDLLAQNSFVEPLGLALMEGAACGKTAVASGVDGVCEVIADGLTGVLVATSDSERLGSEIAEMVRHPEARKKMGAAARQRMVERFSPAQQMKQMHELYRRIAQGGGAGKSGRKS